MEKRFRCRHCGKPHDNDCCQDCYQKAMKILSQTPLAKRQAWLAGFDAQQDQEQKQRRGK